jgi:hypothetical protein
MVSFLSCVLCRYEYAKEIRAWRTFLSAARSLQPLALEGLVKTHIQSEKIKIDYRKARSASVCDAELFYSAMGRGQADRFNQHYHQEVGAADRPLELPRELCEVLVNSSDDCAFDKYELESMLASLDRVERLSILDCPAIDDSAVRLLLSYRRHPHHSRQDIDVQQSRKSLKSLAMVNTKLTNSGLRELLAPTTRAQSAPQMEDLDVSRNRRLTELVVPRSPGGSIRYLSAKSLPNLRKVDLSLIGTSLQSLDLSESHQLQEVVINANQDKSNFHMLHLSGCKNLRTLELDCPGLRTLTCSKCRRLQLVGAYVDRMNLPALEYLNLNACREASDEGVNLLLGRVRLRALNVGGCIRLTRLKATFQDAEGCTLDAYGCKGLGVIEIHAHIPLEKIITTGCGGESGLRVVTFR